MQLSISSELGVEKKYFLDVFVEVYFEPNREKYKCKTIEGYHFPGSMRVSCPQKYIKNFQDGTIFKMDVRLVAKEGYLPYFVATNKKNITRAMEFFDYNLKIQNGFDYKPKTKKVVYIRERTTLKPQQTHDVFETF